MKTTWTNIESTEVDYANDISDAKCIVKVCLSYRAVSIQSVGLLKALYTFPPLTDLFIPTPTLLLLEAF